LDQAAAKFRHAIQLQPESSDAHRYLGLVLERQGDTEGASAAYRKALDLNPGEVSAKESLDRLENARLANDASANASTGPDDPVKVAEFEGYIREGRFKEVEPCSRLRQTAPEILVGLVRSRVQPIRQQKIADSIQALAKSSNSTSKCRGPQDPWRDLMIIGRFDAAQVEFEQGIRYSPQSAEIHYNLGKLFSMQDNWESARKEFDEALRMTPTMWRM